MSQRQRDEDRAERPYPQGDPGVPGKGVKDLALRQGHRVLYDHHHYDCRSHLKGYGPLLEEKQPP